MHKNIIKKYDAENLNSPIKSSNFETFQSFREIQFRKNKLVILLFKTRSIKLPVRILKKVLYKKL